MGCKPRFCASDAFLADALPSAGGLDGGSAAGFVAGFSAVLAAPPQAAGWELVLPDPPRSWGFYGFMGFGFGGWERGASRSFPALMIQLFRNSWGGYGVRSDGVTGWR